MPVGFQNSEISAFRLSLPKEKNGKIHIFQLKVSCALGGVRSLTSDFLKSLCPGLQSYHMHPLSLQSVFVFSSLAPQKGPNQL